MNKAKIVFSNGEELVLSAGNTLTGVNVGSAGDEFFPVLSTPVIVSSAPHDGLISSILLLVNQYPYFYGPDECKTLYVSSSIVKIENL